MSFSWITRLFGRGGASLSCEEVLEVLQSYLDGETDAATARRVSEHLHECKDCTWESSIYERIKESLATPPDHVEPEILDRLEGFVRDLHA